MKPQTTLITRLLQEALALHQQGQLAAAKPLYQRILKQQAAHFDALHLLGLIEMQDGALGKAHALIARAIAIAPQHASAHSNFSLVLQRLQRHPEALASVSRALAITPDFGDALFNRGNILQEMGQPAAALENYDRALQLQPNNVDGYYNRGVARWRLHRMEEALEDYAQALQLKPDHFGAWNNRGIALIQMSRNEEALDSFEHVLRYQPEYGHALAQVLYQLHYLCQWDRLAGRSATLRSGVMLDTPMAETIPPFIFLTLDSSLAEQQRCVRQWAARKMITGPGAASLPAPVRDPARDPARPLRIGYLSSDLHEHATAQLMVAVFEAQHRQGLTCYAYSYGADDGSALRARLEAAFTHFADVSALSARAIAARIRADGIDILIDLKGHTNDSKPEILAYRAAPLQVQYLGYPGTMGSPLIDYLIADRCLIPVADFAYYDEKIVHLPHSYQPNDPQRPIGPKPSRQEAGLPQQGLVFCSFNQSYKITPTVFSQWLRLLHGAPGSVLWLLTPSPTAIANLRRAAQAGGVDGERLIFAPWLEPSAHLGRLQLGDLFLDTSPVNAHTTASDALWAGVPVLTCPGATFAGRVAASLLLAMDLPELIADSPEQYEEIAADLARQPEKLAALRRKTAAARHTSPLFDAVGLARDLTAAYRMMWQRHQDGLAPDHLTVAPSAPTAALLQQGVACYQQGHYDAALVHFDQALLLQAEDIDVLNNRGAVLVALQRYQAALANFEHLLRIAPEHAGALNNRSVALMYLQRNEEALAVLDLAVQQAPEHTDAWCNHGNTLQRLGRYQASLASYERALALDPDCPGALVNCGISLWRVQRMPEALLKYEQLLQRQPQHVSALNNKAVALSSLKRYAEAVQCYEQILQVAPNYHHAAAQALHLRQQLCQWQGLAERAAALRAVVLRQPLASNNIPPFTLLAQASSRTEQQLCARQWAATRLAPGVPPLPPAAPRAAGRRLRIGYLSSDLQEHATAFLMAAVFEAHRQQPLDCIAYSYGRADGSAMRERLQGAFTHFEDISELSDRGAAEKIRADGIDILIDLKGYTEGARSEILSFRAAPLQAQFLGYPGTMGSPMIDYLIADRCVIPPEHADSYDEKIVYLPHCYQPNDPQRAIGPTPTRAEAGLPPEGFIFCCFNQSYKITPDVFDRWMRLLHAVPGSVLWLLISNSGALDHLRQEAHSRGVDPARLIFAPMLPLTPHLGRLALSDLFLDTAPYNAHTTASDALWVGVPVLTCPGATFASRVAASLLQTMGLAELIAADPNDYEQLAYQLATDSAALQALRQKVQAARAGSPLFDAQSFADHLSTAYQMMWRRYQDGLPPAPISL